MSMPWLSRLATRWVAVCGVDVPIGRPKLYVATWMVLTEENTRFCQRSATPGCRASSDAISWYPISVGINAKTQRPIPKDAKRAPFGRLRTTNIDTLTQRHTHTGSNPVHPCNSIFFGGIEFRLRGS